MGWPEGFSCHEITAPVPGWPVLSSSKPVRTRRTAAASDDGGAVDAADSSQASAPPPPARPRPGYRRRREYGPACVDLAGNGMALPDLAMVLYCTLLSNDSDLWQHRVIELESLIERAAAIVVAFDPGSTLAQRRALAIALGEDIPIGGDRLDAARQAIGIGGDDGDEPDIDGLLSDCDSDRFD